MDEKNRVFQAIAIKNDRVLDLGSNQDILKLGDITTIIIDLKGKTVIPGLVESHSHFSTAALSELNDDIFIPQSVSELLDYIKLKVSTLNKGEWIYLRNVYPLRLAENRYPTLEEIDSVAPDNPVYIDGAYAGQANSYAMKLCGINKKTIPVTGKLIKNENTGELNGMFLACGYLIKKYIKTQILSPEEMEDAFRKLQKAYNKLGITSVIEAATPIQNLEIYRNLYIKNILYLRMVYTKLVNDINDPINNIDEFAESIKIPPEWGKLKFIKVFLDGGILTGTAYMRKPYRANCNAFGFKDNEFRGIINYNRNQLGKIINKVSESRLQMTAHCTGNAALDILLSAYEEANADISVCGRRFSIIHANFTDMETLEKIKKMGLVLISQPAWHYKDSVMLAKIIDSETLKSFLPYKEIDELGICVCSGSDHMVKYDSFLSVNPYNPFLGMYNLITRKTYQGEIVAGSQKITRESALKMYTVNGAYATFDEDIKGSLEKGKLADMAVLSKDYFTCREEDIPFIESELTIVGGKLVINT